MRTAQVEVHVPLRQKYDIPSSCSNIWFMPAQEIAGASATLATARENYKRGRMES